MKSVGNTRIYMKKSGPRTCKIEVLKNSNANNLKTITDKQDMQACFLQVLSVPTIIYKNIGNWTRNKFGKRLKNVYIRGTQL